MPFVYKKFSPELVTAVRRNSNKPLIMVFISSIIIILVSAFTWYMLR